MVARASSDVAEILDVEANLALYNPARLPGATFTSIDSPKTWRSNGTVWIGEGGAAVAPDTQIVFGTGTGIGSSEELTFGSHVFAQLDSLLARFVNVDGTAANRTFELRNAADADIFAARTSAGTEYAEFQDNAGQPILHINAQAGSRVVTFEDDAAQPMLEISTLATSRSLTLYDGSGFAMMFAFTQTAQRTWAFSDNNEAPVLALDLKVAARSSTWQTETSAGVLAITARDAHKTIVASVPVTFASSTVGALPTPPTGGAGSMQWASNGRKTGEGGGAGTGVLVSYSTAGPAGAGWYPVGVTAALVTA